MINSQQFSKIEESLAKFSDKLLLRTILYNLEDADVRVFIDLLLTEKFDEAEKLVEEKIPDLEDKVEKERKKRLEAISKRVKDERK
ncbi:hypothetical protein ISS86_03120 [Candidatus Microgenomates bacterium]|nr:hypothetical protein [Candidatus Microgenomates bacterium]